MPAIASPENQKPWNPVLRLACTSALVIAMSGCLGGGDGSNSKTDDSFRVLQSRDGSQSLNDAAAVVHYAYGVLRFSSESYDIAVQAARFGTFAQANGRRVTACNQSGQVTETQTGDNLTVSLQNCHQRQQNSAQTVDRINAGQIDLECLNPRSGASCAAGMAQFTNYVATQEQLSGDEADSLKRRLLGQMDYLADSERGEFTELSVKVDRSSSTMGDQGYAIDFEAGAVFDRVPAENDGNGDTINGRLALTPYGYTSCPSGAATFETTKSVFYDGSDAVAIGGELKITDDEGTVAIVLFNDDGSATVTVGDEEVVVPRAFARLACEPSKNL